VFLYVRQDSLVFHPHKDWKTTPAQAGIPFEEIYFISDGLKLSGWWMPVEGAKGTLLFCHGNAGTVAYQMDTVILFHEMRYNVLLFDYRGFGKSEGQISEEGLYRDSQAAWDYLTKNRGILKEQIIIGGRSLGAAVAARLAAKNKPAALILESGFTSLREAAQSHYPLFPVKWLLKYHFDTLSWLRQVTCPVLIAHSRSDKVVSFSHSQTLYSAVQGSRKFVEIFGSHHEGYAQSREVYRKALSEFL
jgi:fermentation-respiration switch protein FrsA (DUF1100 family)